MLALNKLEPLFSLPHSVPSVRKNVNTSISFTTSNDPYKTPIATAFQQSSSPEAVLQLFYEREKAIKEYRDTDRKLIKCLSPAVKVLQAFSDIIGEAVTQEGYEEYRATM